MKIVNCYWLVDNTFGSWPLDDKGFDDLPLLMRRRLTPLGHKALQIVNRCALRRGESIPWIVSCRHGDISRRLNLLSNLSQNEMLSPTDFSLSVHNAVIGMFSIATGNHLTHSALAGGCNSFEVGLLEAIALLKEKGGAIGYTYYDSLRSSKEEELIDRLDHNGPIECFALILGVGCDGMTIEYKVVKKPNKLKKFKLTELLEYLKNDEKRYTIPVAGGEILFKRTS